MMDRFHEASAKSFEARVEQRCNCRAYTTASVLRSPSDPPSCSTRCHQEIAAVSHIFWVLYLDSRPITGWDWVYSKILSDYVQMARPKISPLGLQSSLRFSKGLFVSRIARYVLSSLAGSSCLTMPDSSGTFNPVQSSESSSFVNRTEANRNQILLGSTQGSVNLTTCLRLLRLPHNHLLIPIQLMCSLR